MGIHVKINSFCRNHVRLSDIKRQRAALILAAKDMMESSRSINILWLSERGATLPSSGWAKVEVTWNKESPEEVYEEVCRQVELFGQIVKIVVATHDLNAAEQLKVDSLRYTGRMENLRILQSIAENTGRQAALDWWIENT